MDVQIWNTLQPGERIAEPTAKCLETYEVVNREVPTDPSEPHIVELRADRDGRCLHSRFPEKYLTMGSLGK